MALTQHACNQGQHEFSGSFAAIDEDLVLRLGTANAEDILRRFTRNNVQHPTYRALAALGQACKTRFLCRSAIGRAFRYEICPTYPDGESGRSTRLSISRSKEVDVREEPLPFVTDSILGD